jgi:hypothetical protein
MAPTQTVEEEHCQAGASEEVNTPAIHYTQQFVLYRKNLGMGGLRDLEHDHQRQVVQKERLGPPPARYVTGHCGSGTMDLRSGRFRTWEGCLRCSRLWPTLSSLVCAP